MVLIPSVCVASPLKQVLDSKHGHSYYIRWQLKHENILDRVADIDPSPCIIFDQKLAQAMVPNHKHHKFIYNLKHQNLSQMKRLHDHQIAKPQHRDNQKSMHL